MASSHTNDKIQLCPMIQLSEAVDQDDNWTGVTSATERRKRQNRLSSRAFRRRRALEDAQSVPSLAPAVYESEAELLIPCWSEAHQTIILLAASTLPSRLRDSREPLLPNTAIPTRLEKVIFPLSPDHLMTLLQYNVLRACLVNRDFISRLQPHGEKWSSTALTLLPTLNEVDLSHILPPSLHPTLLQRTIPHAAWIDILPHPTLRDNLILLTTTASAFASQNETETAPPVTFDEDALWTDTVRGLFEGVSDSRAAHNGGIVWNNPWDVSGWELSAGFWRKHKSLFKGCEAEVLQATNRWRRQRHEPDLIVVESTP